MNKYHIYTILVACLWSGVCHGQNKWESLPNIILILADDLGYGDVSLYNENAAFQTPHIDQLADQGVAFMHAYTSSSVCTPTRYGILTGRYNWRSTLKQGVLWGYSHPLIDPERLTVGGMLQSANYETGFIGKWHLGWDWAFTSEPAGNLDNPGIRPEVDYTRPIQNGPLDRGFKYAYAIPASLDMAPYVYVENNLPTALPVDTTVSYDMKGWWRKGPTSPDFDHSMVLPHLTGKAVEFIEEKSQGADPFFLYFALPAPHTPILPLSEFIGKSNTNFYGDFVLQVDDLVGQITETLANLGILEETILIFTSDNGASPRSDFAELAHAGHDPSYIFRGHKADIFEGGLRVPFLVSWPGQIDRSVRSDEIISTVDFMATFADLTGFDVPDHAGEDSYSFLPILYQDNYHKPLREATVLHSVDGRFAIVKDQWKLIVWPGSGGWSPPTAREELEGLPAFQLYNLTEDPSEQQNLVARYPRKVETLKTLLEQYISEGRSTPGRPQKNDGPEMWTQLDWMDD